MGSEASLEIEAVLHAYCELIDRREPARLASEVFADEVRVDMGYGVWSGAAAASAALQLVVSRFAASAHVLTNIRTQLTGRDARSTSYVTAWHWAPAESQPAEREADFATVGVYLDRLRRETAGWRILERRFRRLGPSGVAIGRLPAYLRGAADQLGLKD